MTNIAMLEATTSVSLGFLTEGPLGLSPTLSISWEDAEMTAANWASLQTCQQWQIKARYNGDDIATLKLTGQANSIPIGPVLPYHNGTIQIRATPSFEGEWTIDAWGVGLFMSGARRFGYFVLFPATNMQISTVLAPIVAFLKRRES